LEKKVWVDPKVGAAHQKKQQQQSKQKLETTTPRSAQVGTIPSKFAVSANREREISRNLEETVKRVKEQDRVSHSIGKITKTKKQKPSLSKEKPKEEKQK
jgi:hypothetical protein